MKSIKLVMSSILCLLTLMIASGCGLVSQSASIDNGTEIPNPVVLVDKLDTEEGTGDESSLPVDENADVNDEFIGEPELESPEDADASQSDPEELFDVKLKRAISQRDYDELASLMSDSFGFALWLSEGYAETPDQAVESLRNFYMPDEAELQFPEQPDVSSLFPEGNVLKVWNPDVNPVRAVFSSGWGDDGTGEVFLIIAEPESGQFEWSGLLYAPEGFIQDDALVIFERRLLDAVALRDYESMAQLMSESFTFGLWQSEGYALPLDEAVSELQNNFLGEGNIEQATSPDLSNVLPGGDVLRIWNPADNPVRAVFTVGWGAESAGEAFLIIVDMGDGDFAWGGMIYAGAGFAEN